MAPPPATDADPLDVTKFRAQASLFNVAAFEDAESIKNWFNVIKLVYLCVSLFYLVLATEVPTCEVYRPDVCNRYNIWNVGVSRYRHGDPADDRSAVQDFLLAQPSECAAAFDIVSTQGVALNRGFTWVPYHVRAASSRLARSLTPEVLMGLLGVDTDPTRFIGCVLTSTITDDAAEMHNFFVRVGRGQILFQTLFATILLALIFERRRIRYSIVNRYSGPTIRDLRSTDTMSRDVLLGDAHYAVVSVFELTGDMIVDFQRLLEGRVWRREVVSLELFVALMNARFVVDGRDKEKLFTAMCQRAGIEDRIALDRYTGAVHDVAANTARFAFYYKMSITRHLPAPGF
jgi:hypothetical protein